MKPGFCSIGIIDSCVLRCKMCYKWQEIIDHNALPALNDWQRTLDSLKVLRGNQDMQVIFAGGEVLQYNNILELIRFAGERGFSTVLTSSGFLLDDMMISKLARAGLGGITLSLDSLEMPKHDFLRGREGVFARVMRAIDLLYSRKIAVCVSAIIMESNLEEIISMAQWAFANDKINNLLFLAPMQPNNTAEDTYWYDREEFSFLWPRDKERACEIIEIIKEIKFSSNGRGHKILNTAPQLEAFKNYFREPDKFVKNVSCTMGQALHISSSGDIFLCYNFPSIGNIRRDLIDEAWNSPKALEVRAGIRECRKNCHFLLNCFFGD